MKRNKPVYTIYFPHYFPTMVWGKEGEDYCYDQLRIIVKKGTRLSRVKP